MSLRPWVVLPAVLFALVVVGAWSGLVPARAANHPDGHAEAGSATTGPPHQVKATLLANPPAMSASQQNTLRAAQRHANLPGPKLAQGVGPLAAGAPTVPQTSAAPIDSTKLALSSTDLSSALPAGAADTIDEPSAAINGDVVFETGNFYAAESLDGGHTFEYIDPGKTFPPAYSGQYIDQSVIYDPSRDLTFWVLMYFPMADSDDPDLATTARSVAAEPADDWDNEIRLAVARGKADLANGVWTYYDLTPNQIGLPAASHYDYPHLALGSNNLYVTTNVFVGDTNPPYCDNTKEHPCYETAIMRLPLDQLAAGTRPLTYDNVHTSDHFSFTATQGATTTIYWAAHSGTSSLRLYHWDEGSPTPLWDDVAVTTFPDQTGVCRGPDGRSWCGLTDHRIRTAWISNGVIGFMWSASQGDGGFGTFPYPYVQVALFDANTRDLIGEPIIWNQNYAVMYPAVGVNSAGALAGTLFYGGGSLYPTVGAFIWDGPGAPRAPWELYQVAQSASDPTQDIWGDFLTAAPRSPAGTDWIATGYTLDNAQSIHPLFLSLGRPEGALQPRIYLPLVRR